MHQNFYQLRKKTHMILAAMLAVILLLSVPSDRLLADTVTDISAETVTEDTAAENTAADDEVTADSAAEAIQTEDAGEEDTVTADTQTEDTQTADTQTADTQTADTQTADTQTEDTQTEDIQTEDIQTEDTRTEDDDFSDTATIWIVGDSTLAVNNTTGYYMKRVGYGTVLEDYFDADIYNLAVCGASSRSFKDLTSYNTLINGSDTVPALGDADGKKFLIIGFGHNDTLDDDIHFTDPSGDYQTSGSFAYYLYTYYVKPALDAGVTPVLCTPIVRWADDNSMKGYNSYYGHITEAGDYPQAIRNLAKQLGNQVILLDMTAASKNMNIMLGTSAKMMHAYSGAEFDQTTCTVTPTGFDITHTNLYGAHMNAWLLSQICSFTSLGTFTKDTSRPTEEEYLTESINSNYKIADSTGLFQGQDGTWRYYTNGSFDNSRTGMVRTNQGSWYYVKNGLIDYTYTGMAKNQYGWWYITKGKLDRTYTGMAKNQYGWWYITKGKLDLTYTGMAKNQYGWWYMTNGKLNSTYTGLGTNAYGTWYFKNGKLQTSFTGYVTISGKKYYVKKGKVVK